MYMDLISKNPFSIYLIKPELFIKLKLKITYKNSILKFSTGSV